MRNEFIGALTSAAKQNCNVFLIVGDLGYGVIEPFRDVFPDRFLNAGVAEQSMMSIAGGIASQGPTVFAYSIANFPTFRALEQIRNDIAAHNLPVVIVSIGAGLAYGTLGYTHHAVEDLGIMRAIPGIEIYSPGDVAELNAVMPLILGRKKPTYLRLGKGGEKDLHAERPAHPERGVIVSRAQKDDFLVLSTGAIGSAVAEALTLVNLDLSRRVTHYSIPVFAAVDSLESVFSRSQGIITVEEHRPSGGLGSLILEFLSQKGTQTRLRTIGTKEGKSKIVGTHEFLRKQHQLDPDSLALEFEGFFGSIDVGS